MNPLNTRMKGNLLILILCGYSIFCKCSPADVENRLCPNITKYVRDNTSAFSSLGARCTPENDAYVLGSMFQKYSTMGKSFDKPTLEERWQQVVYLDASEFDEPGSIPPSSATAPTCIYNERLAMQHQHSGKVYVGTQCDPFALSYCRTEYDGSQSIKDWCDCNHLYSIKERNESGSWKCYAKAGVPCKFSTSGRIIDPFLMAPTEIECHSSLVCKDENRVQMRGRIFNTSFQGFGLNPVVHEFMLATATAYCDCRDTRTMQINAVNECVAAGTTQLCANAANIYIAWSVSIALLILSTQNDVLFQFFY